MNTITKITAQENITKVVESAIQGLPYENEGRKWQAEQNLRMFQDGTYEMLHLEFGISFHVTASLSVTKVIGAMTYAVSVSQSSGLRTLSQQQASHDLMGAVLKAAHAVQAVIDGLPTITKG